jgi:hypothetical protein
MAQRKIISGVAKISARGVSGISGENQRRRKTANKWRRSRNWRESAYGVMACRDKMTARRRNGGIGGAQLMASAKKPSKSACGQKASDQAALRHQAAYNAMRWRVAARAHRYKRRAPGAPARAAGLRPPLARAQRQRRERAGGMAAAAATAACAE